MTERRLKQAILEHEEDYAAAAESDDPESDTAGVLLSWARGEDVDPEKARRLLDRAEANQ